jgi:molecular chaperone HtpG
VAPEHGMDRQMERMLAGAGRLGALAKPILEINPRHDLVVRLSGLGEAETSLRQDAAHLLLDEARIMDGETPVDPRAFAERLARVIGRAASH